MAIMKIHKQAGWNIFKITVKHPSNISGAEARVTETIKLQQ
jgi:hypothetical protein